ncbi:MULTISPECIES: amidohydrolase [unclassified Ornithinimicrobium]|uniref:amidohydrolase n=1 Tax=unclassified Ornithinimicrobium TaxID=2615080 RepID=UPI0038534E74
MTQPFPSSTPASAVLSGLGAIRPWLEDLYRHLHAHPELSMAEHETAARVVREVRGMPGGQELEVVEGIAGTGVAVVVRNGEGPTVLLRADMDGLPVAEDTGLDYASRVVTTNLQGESVPVMHACGHDTHVATLLASMRLLLDARQEWAGTVLAVFQPAEEQHNGAEAMVRDGLVERLPRPDVALGQHVLPGPAGSVKLATGPIMASCDDFRITLRGKGGHGSAPHTAIDPVVMAASLVMRLQTIVARQVPPRATAVVTVGRIQAGTKTNIIPSTAVLEGTVRTYDAAVAATCLAAIERTARAEAAAWGAPEPVIEHFDHLPVTDNDPGVTERVRAALVAELGGEQVRVFEPESGSEDFSALPDAWGAPYTYWGFGAFDAQEWVQAEDGGRTDDFPDNHSPHFAPVLQPVLDTGVRAMVAASMAWLGDRHWAVQPPSIV